MPAIMANEWASAMFRSAIEANNGHAIESNSASETHPSETQDLSGPGRIRTGDLRRVRAASYRARPPALLDRMASEQRLYFFFAFGILLLSLRFLLWHFLHLVAFMLFLAPHLLQIFAFNLLA